jgi:hypothetical protein
VIDVRVNFPEVELMIQSFLEQLEYVVKVAQGGIAMRIFELAINRSPVDTGRFRWNWMMSVGEVPTTYDPTAGGQLALGKPPAGGPVLNPNQITDGMATVTDLLTMKLGQVVWIANNTHYAIYLEAGHSQQAPNGIALLAVQDAIMEAEYQNVRYRLEA